RWYCTPYTAPQPGPERGDAIAQLYPRGADRTSVSFRFALVSLRWVEQNAMRSGAAAGHATRLQFKKMTGIIPLVRSEGLSSASKIKGLDGLTGYWCPLNRNGYFERWSYLLGARSRSHYFLDPCHATTTSLEQIENKL